MSQTFQKAIIHIDHGSRLAEANRLLDQIAASLQAQLPNIFIQPTHMELAGPTLEQGFYLCADHSVKEIIVVPYFLGPGRHTTQDIPFMCEEAGKKFPNVTYQLVKPLGFHEKIIEAIRERAGI